ncbi:hypothetical protein QVD17_39377 [Tagetes erecta]|uniref:Uncharacterized protein n=1 Tax=Tagetes erecta TaxID=13708 RepID=A0AAD8JQ54_TARER|nr:hypothetical protein QVD17_39377 [Tagetes erecta]
MSLKKVLKFKVIRTPSQYDVIIVRLGKRTLPAHLMLPFSAILNPQTTKPFFFFFAPFHPNPISDFVS